MARSEIDESDGTYWSDTRCDLVVRAGATLSRHADLEGGTETQQSLSVLRVLLEAPPVGAKRCECERLNVRSASGV